MNGVSSALPPLRLFVSYSHKDKIWFERFSPLLELETNYGTVRAWHDTEIISGSGWDQEIREALDQMEMFICLVSVDFLTSPYIRDVELSKAIERYESGQTEIVPVVLYPMNLQRYHPFLFGRNPLPEFGKSWRDVEREAGDWKDALYTIGNGLSKAIEKARALPGRDVTSSSRASRSQAM